MGVITEDTKLREMLILDNQEKSAAEIAELYEVIAERPVEPKCLYNQARKMDINLSLAKSRKQIQEDESEELILSRLGWLLTQRFDSSLSISP